MKLFSLLFGRKKEVAPRAEPAMGSTTVIIPSPTLERPPALPQAEPAPAPTIPLETRLPELPPAAVQLQPPGPKTLPRRAPWEHRPGPTSRSQARVQWPKGWPMQVVDEVHNQEALIALYGPYRWQVGMDFGWYEKADALIELEPTNPKNPDAVVVKIGGRRVGYLPKDQAARVAQQMREDGIEAAACDAKVEGGWRVNQHEGGIRYYEVKLGIPEKGWVDFGIGALPPLQPGTNRPMSAGRGPLHQHNIALLGIEPDSDAARYLAAKGAKITASLGVSTTFLVVGAEQPFSDEIRGGKTYRKAEEMIAKGARLRIVSLGEVLTMIDLTSDSYAVRRPQ